MKIAAGCVQLVDQSDHDDQGWLFQPQIIDELAQELKSGNVRSRKAKTSNALSPNNGDDQVCIKECKQPVGRQTRNDTEKVIIREKVSHVSASIRRFLRGSWGWDLRHSVMKSRKGASITGGATILRSTS